MGIADTLATARAGGHGVKFFVVFFGQNPQYQEFFPKLKGLSGSALADSPALAAQANLVLDAIEKCIAGDVKSVIRPIAQSHVGYKVTPAYFGDALKAFVKYLGDNGLDTAGWDAATAAILAAFTEAQG